jgi:hypothetical protein
MDGPDVEGGRRHSDYIILGLDGYLELYDPHDPSPLPMRDRNEEVFSYLERAYDDLSDKEDFDIEVHLPKGAYDKELEDEARAAIHGHFEREAMASRRELREGYLRAAGYSLVGVGLLAASALVPQLASAPGMASKLAADVVQIGGWVWCWEAIASASIGSRSRRGDVERYERLARADIEFVYRDGPA